MKDSTTSKSCGEYAYKLDYSFKRVTATGKDLVAEFYRLVIFDDAIMILGNFDLNDWSCGSWFKEPGADRSKPKPEANPAPGSPVVVIYPASYAGYEVFKAVCSRLPQNGKNLKLPISEDRFKDFSDAENMADKTDADFYWRRFQTSQTIHFEELNEEDKASEAWKAIEGVSLTAPKPYTKGSNNSAPAETKKQVLEANLEFLEGNFEKIIALYIRYRSEQVSDPELLNGNLTFETFLKLIMG